MTGAIKRKTAAAASGNAVTARNEGADGYSHLVAQINAQTRVVECTAGIQWVVQRSVIRAHDRQWRGVSFCRTKQALLRCVREWVPGEHPTLQALPDRFPEEVAIAGDASMTTSAADFQPAK